MAIVESTATTELLLACHDGEVGARERLGGPPLSGERVGFMKDAPRKGIAIGPGAEQEAKGVMQQPEFTIRVKIGGGKAKSQYVMCDIGHDYVKLNGAYRT